MLSRFAFSHSAVIFLDLFLFLFRRNQAIRPACVSFEGEFRSRVPWKIRRKRRNIRKWFNYQLTRVSRSSKNEAKMGKTEGDTDARDATPGVEQIVLRPRVNLEKYN